MELFGGRHASCGKETALILKPKAGVNLVAGPCVFGALSDSKWKWDGSLGCWYVRPIRSEKLASKKVCVKSAIIPGSILVFCWVVRTLYFSVIAGYSLKTDRSFLKTDLFFMKNVRRML